jgi:hypothetical protein
MEEVEAMTIPDPIEEDPEECDSCHSQDVALGTFEQGIGTKRHNVRLCVLCAGTHAGNALEYPDQYPAAVLKTICFVGNEIIKTLQKGDYADET